MFIWAAEADNKNSTFNSFNKKWADHINIINAKRDISKHHKYPEWSKYLIIIKVECYDAIINTGFTVDAFNVDIFWYLA